MKNLVKWLPAFLSILSFTSCNEQEAPIKYGRIQLEFNSANGKLASETASVLITIIKPDGTIVKDMVKLTLYSFGNGYVSESVELPVGHYDLTQFLILDSDNNVRYACPVEGSEQAQYVDDPLPIHFEVTEDKITSVVPQVLEVTPDADPESFGYVNFGFEIVPLPEENSVQLILDGTLWKATYVEQAVYVDETKFFVITGRKVINESTKEALWIMIPNMELALGEVPSDNIEIQMGFNESEYTGTYYDSDFTTPREVNVNITSYDPLTDLISGKFSTKITNLHDGTQKVITLGVFYKVKLTHQ